MRYLLSLLVISVALAGSAFGQACVPSTTQACTSNVGLALPNQNSPAWGVPLNQNFNWLDSLLSGASTGTSVSFANLSGIDSIVFVDGVKYATWAAAATACSGANCTIVIPSTYAGLDCPSAAAGLYTIDMRGMGPANPPCGQNTDTYNGQTATVFSYLRHSLQVNSPLNKSYELTTNVAQFSGTFPASTQSLEGVTSVAVTTGAVTIPNASTALVGLESHGWIQSTGATLPSLYGFVTGNQLYAASTTNVTTSYGLRVQALVNGGSGTVTNNYGLYLDAQTGGSTRNFSFYSGGAGLFASDAASSGINFEDSALAAHPVFTALSATNQMRFRPLLDSAGYDFMNAASSTEWLSLNSSGISIPTLKLTIGAGVIGDGGGFKHKRGTAGCATAASSGAVCTTVVTWTSAFADANYTATCTGDLVTSGVPGGAGLTAKSAASVTFQTVAETAAAAQYTTIECMAVHD